MFTNYGTDSSLSGMSSTQESASGSPGPGQQGSSPSSPGSSPPSPGSGSDQSSAVFFMMTDDDPISERTSSPGTAATSFGDLSPGRSSHLGSQPSEPSERAFSPVEDASPSRSDRSGHASDATGAASGEDSSNGAHARTSSVLRIRSSTNMDTNTASTSRQCTNQQPVDVGVGVDQPPVDVGVGVDQPTSGGVVRPSDGQEPPSKRRVEAESDQDGETCPICLEAWANSGLHRLVSLKCGHLFGKNCLERWLRARPARDRYCPTCKAKATVRDMRHIFARRLVATDSSEIQVLQGRVEQLQAEKNRVELELQKSKISHKACVTQLEGLRSTLMKSQGQKEAPVRKHWRFALEKNLEMSRGGGGGGGGGVGGGCRVLTYNCRTYEFYVSQQSSNNIFPGYGIRKVSCVDYTPGQFVHLHTKCIRDMTYSTQRDLLLSVGLDNTAKIVERGILTTTIQAGFPLWSCSWDYLRTNECYVGGIGGQTLQYDIRNPSAYLQRLIAESDLSPVASLKSTEHGLLSCQLNSCWLWVTTGRLAGSNDQYEPRSLPIDGPFMSLTYDEESHRALIACRPLAEGARSRLASCKLRTQGTTGEVLVDHEQTFPGSVRTTLMSRPAWVKAPGACWVAAHSESDATLYLHGLDGARTMALPAAEPAVDVHSVQLHGDSVLAALSQQRLRLYRAVPTNS